MGDHCLEASTQQSATSLREQL